MIGFVGNPSYLGDKSVTVLWHRLDVFLFADALAETVPDSMDWIAEIVLFDDRVRPDSLEQFFFCEQRAVVPQEMDESLKGLFGKSVVRHAIAPDEFAFSNIEEKIADLE